MRKMNQCPICTLMVKNSRELYYHLRSFHYGDTSSENENYREKRRKLNTDSTPVHKCSICAEEFSMIRLLYRHLRGHFKEQQQMTEPAIKRRKLILGQQGCGVTKQNKDRNAK